MKVESARNRRDAEDEEEDRIERERLEKIQAEEEARRKEEEERLRVSICSLMPCSSFVHLETLSLVLTQDLNTLSKKWYM